MTRDDVERAHGAVDESAVPTLPGERVRLRPLAEADLPRLAELVADPAVARWWGVHDEARLRETIAEASLAWTIEVAGEVAGLLIASEEPDPDYRGVDLDLFLSAALRGEGLGPDALRTALRWLFGGRAHHRATIGPSAENARAIRSYERVGFRPVGVLRRAERLPGGGWHDTLLMDMLPDELR